jgi:hypothetical protein
MEMTTKAFVGEVRRLEERLFADQLGDAGRMKSDRYSWHYRPSHHAASGLVTPDDIGKHILSVGAFPAYLERVLCELGATHIVIADNDPAIAEIKSDMKAVVFDATKPWPAAGGTFDLIIFPESLCICMSDLLKKDSDVPFATDTLEAELLSGILGQALSRLRPGGEIRANGPMSHPNVVAAAKAKLEQAGQKPVIEYQRFFLRVRL